MLTLVDLFGDVPYSQAFQGTDELNPAADAGASVYDAAIGLLDNAISDLGNPTGTITNDIFYGGSDASWIKAANSLKLKAHLNTGNTAQINTLFEIICMSNIYFVCPKIGYFPIDSILQTYKCN